MRQPRTLSRSRQALRVAAALALATLTSCGDGRNFPKVRPVKGKVLVNGQPAGDCQVFLNRTAGDNLSMPVTPQAVTNDKGEFQITSYHTNDGAPEGEYVVTIEWRERSGLAKQDFDGPDRLGGAYAKMEKTKGLPGFVVKVGPQAQDLPPFELKQSAEAKRRADEARKPHLSGQGPIQ